MGSRNLIFLVIYVLLTGCSQNEFQLKKRSQEIVDNQSEEISVFSVATPVSEWTYPNEDEILPAYPLGTAIGYFNQIEDRRVDITSKFTHPKKIIDSPLYNPNVIHDPDDKDYPFKIYIFGWGNKNQVGWEQLTHVERICNSHLPYFSLYIDPTLDEFWCDAIFYGRSKSIDGPWEFLTHELNSDGSPRFSTHSPLTWKPVLYSGLSKVWDWHHAGDPSVIKLGDGHYLMAYSVTGYNLDEVNQQRGLDGEFAAINLAYSKDGINWTKMKEPPLKAKFDVGRPKEVVGIHFHRPSIMYDGNKFRIWFDYNPRDLPGSLGHAELSGPSQISTVLNGNWKLTQYDDKPAIISWPNPRVVKTPVGYFSYSDAASPDGKVNNVHWTERQITEAYSVDGLNWKITGRFVLKADQNGDFPCIGMVPEVLYHEGKLHLFKSCWDSRIGDGETASVELVTRKDLSITDQPGGVCVAGEAASCQTSKGKGQKYCNVYGTGYTNCQETSCNEGFTLNNGQCGTCESSQDAKDYLYGAIYFFELNIDNSISGQLADICKADLQIAVQEFESNGWLCDEVTSVASQVQSCVDQVIEKKNWTCLPNSIQGCGDGGQKSCNANGESYSSCSYDSSLFESNTNLIPKIEYYLGE